MSQRIGIEKVTKRQKSLGISDENFAPIFDYFYDRDDLVKKFALTSRIDQYGDTYYNVRQAERLLNEFEQLKEELPADLQKSLDEIIKFIGSLRPHTFIKFIGD